MKINFKFRFEWLLSVRAITQKPLAFFLKMKEDFCQQSLAYGTERDPNFSPDFVYDESDYKVLFNFVNLQVGHTFLWFYENDGKTIKCYRQK